MGNYGEKLQKYWPKINKRVTMGKNYKNIGPKLTKEKGIDECKALHLV